MIDMWPPAVLQHNAHLRGLMRWNGKHKEKGLESRWGNGEARSVGYVYVMWFLALLFGCCCRVIVAPG